MNKKKFAGDFLLNLMASAVTTISTQIVLFPLLAKIYSAETYGIILTISGVANTIIATFGNSLNNTRLVVNTDYDERRLHGDFSLMMLGAAILGALSMLIYVVTGVRSSSPTVIVLLLLFVFGGILRNYGNVAFRLRLNYSNILLLSIGIAIGNTVGIILLSQIGNDSFWPIPFVVGEFIGVLFIILKSNIYKEPLKLTALFRTTLGKEIILLLTTLSSNLLVYLDRLLLLPLLGGEAVTIYTVAAFFGKSLGILFTPMSSVFLSYYAQRGYKMDTKRFWTINGIVFGISSFFYLCSVVLSKPITGLLYPTIIENASPYLRTANLAAVITVTANMTQPSVLKFAKTYWQIIIQALYCIMYLGLGVYLANSNGIMGFSIAALIAAVIRLLLLYIIGDLSLRSKRIQIP